MNLPLNDMLGKAFESEILTIGTESGRRRPAFLFDYCNDRVCGFGIRRWISWKSDAPAEIVDGRFEDHLAKFECQLRAYTAAPSVRLIEEKTVTY